MKGGSKQTATADITLYRNFYYNGSTSTKEISNRDLTVMNSSSTGGWPIEEPATIEKIRNYYLSQEGIESCDVEIIGTIKGKIRKTKNNETVYSKLANIPFINWAFWNKFDKTIITFNIQIKEDDIDAKFAKLEKDLEN